MFTTFTINDPMEAVFETFTDMKHLIVTKIISLEVSGNRKSPKDEYYSSRTKSVGSKRTLELKS